MLQEAQAYTGLREKSALVREAFKSLKASVEREARAGSRDSGGASAAVDAAEVILADTSVWIEHLRVGNGALRDFLDRGRVLGHPFRDWRTRAR